MSNPDYCNACGTTAEPIATFAVIRDSDPNHTVEWALCLRCSKVPSVWTGWRPAGEFARQKRAAYVTAQRLGRPAPTSRSLSAPRTESGRKKRWTAAERRARREQHDNGLAA